MLPCNLGIQVLCLNTSPVNYWEFCEKKIDLPFKAHDNESANMSNFVFKNHQKVQREKNVMAKIKESNLDYITVHCISVFVIFLFNEQLFICCCILIVEVTFILEMQKKKKETTK